VVAAFLVRKDDVVELLKRKQADRDVPGPSLGRNNVWFLRSRAAGPYASADQLMRVTGRAAVCGFITRPQVDRQGVVIGWRRWRAGGIR
jgi:hypothetical protein